MDCTQDLHEEFYQFRSESRFIKIVKGVHSVVILPSPSHNTFTQRLSRGSTKFKSDTNMTSSTLTIAPCRFERIVALMFEFSEPTIDPMPEKTRQGGPRNCSLETVRRCLSLPIGCDPTTPSTLSSLTFSLDCEDVVFVSVDTKRVDLKEFSISVLDTRDLKSLNRTSDCSSVIKTYSYAYQAVGKVGQQTCDVCPPLQRIEERWVPRLLNNILCTGSPDPKVEEERVVILVGSSIGTDPQSPFGSPFGSEPVVKVPLVDIVQLCADGFETMEGPVILGVPEEYFCDACLMFKVMMILAIDSSDLGTTEEQERRAVLEAVVHAHLA
ncbi:uncharacterized protein LY89DRAFT_681832 [Mollisia scopiformis]|uniref:Uncharacterized protein n=1 Tax=Mollisia scopiformis TaxID=149040 RepID=A0A194XLX9_MOLSC|nr:uncharacterized protein LY89DRAFT_681832 [Mollisia scopiformis]KUJ21250.1 hypothetical protein LY89DRAFT_681832 [Mollisia scopiformis]